MNTDREECQFAVRYMLLVQPFNKQEESNKTLELGQRWGLETNTDTTGMNPDCEQCSKAPGTIGLTLWTQETGMTENDAKTPCGPPSHTVASWLLPHWRHLQPQCCIMKDI